MDCLAIWLGDDAEAWLREAVHAAFGAISLHDLDATTRALAFQRTVVVVQALEQDGCPLDMIGPDGERDFLLWPSGSIEPPEPGDLFYAERVSAAFTRAFGVEVALSED